MYKRIHFCPQSYVNKNSIYYLKYFFPSCLGIQDQGPRIWSWECFLGHNVQSYLFVGFLHKWYWSHSVLRGSSSSCMGHLLLLSCGAAEQNFIFPLITLCGYSTFAIAKTKRWRYYLPWKSVQSHELLWLSQSSQFLTWLIFHTEEYLQH